MARGALALAGGLLSLVGALCYAELATAYPEEGGDYVYLRRAFGRRPGFLFAWSQLWIVRPGSIGAMAYVFARYANELWPRAEGAASRPRLVAYAALPVVILTAINMLGVREGKWTQNLLTAVKVVGTGRDCRGRPAAARSSPAHGVPAAPATGTAGPASLYLAMILVLWTYGGWNEMAYVGAEVRRPEKNILRALLLGTVAVTVIYVLLNLVFVHAVGFAAMCRSRAVAADVLRAGARPVGRPADQRADLHFRPGGHQRHDLHRRENLLCAGHRLSARWPAWDDGAADWGTPAWSLFWQGVIVLALIVGFGWWTQGKKDGFESMVEFTSPIFWTFFLLVGLSLFALRRREADRPRPFRVPFYPALPALFCLSSLFMLYACLRQCLGAHGLRVRVGRGADAGGRGGELLAIVADNRQ